MSMLLKVPIQLAKVRDEAKGLRRRGFVEEGETSRRLDKGAEAGLGFVELSFRGRRTGSFTVRVRVAGALRVGRSLVGRIGRCWVSLFREMGGEGGTGGGGARRGDGVVVG